MGGLSDVFVTVAFSSHSVPGALVSTSGLYRCWYLNCISAYLPTLSSQRTFC